MSEKTCRYCKQKYEDNWTNWVSKYCCKECYRHKKRLYNIGDIIYTYNDKKQKDKTLEAYVTTGTIINIYEVNRPTDNGLWLYAVRMNDVERTKDRFEHQLFSNVEEANKFVKITNERRVIMREANKLLKKL